MTKYLLEQLLIRFQDYIYYKRLDFKSRKFKKLIQSLTPVIYKSLPNEPKIYKPIIVEYPIKLKEDENNR